VVAAAAAVVAVAAAVAVLACGAALAGTAATLVRVARVRWAVAALPAGARRRVRVRRVA